MEKSQEKKTNILNQDSGELIDIVQKRENTFGNCQGINLKKLWNQNVITVEMQKETMELIDLTTQRVIKLTMLFLAVLLVI